MEVFNNQSSNGNGTSSFSSNGASDSLSGKVNIAQDLQARGANESGKMSGNPIGLSLWLDRIYNQSVTKINGLNNQQEEKIKRLQISIAGLESHNESEAEKISNFENITLPQKKEKILDLNAEKEQEVKQKKESINELRVEIEKIRGGDLNLIGSEVKAGDRAGFYIGALILVCLTLYLILFYTSVIYNAFIFDLTAPQNASNVETYANQIFQTTIVNLNAIPNTWASNGFLGVSFIFLATAVFLALGYLIHKFNQDRSYIKTILLYIFTFLFDALLAFEIVRKIHEAKYNSGLVEEPWEFMMFASEVSFWIILCAGFIVYILWGLILSYSLEESDKLQPAKMAMNVRNQKIKQLSAGIESEGIRIKALIDGVKAEMEEIKNSVAELKDKIQNNLTAIDTKNREIDTIKNTVEIPTSEVINKIKTFSVGWTNHINAAFIGEQKENLIQKCQEIIDTYILKIKPISTKIDPIQ